MRGASLFLGQELLTDDLRICSNFFERGRGLLGRPPLTAEKGDALLIPRCNSVHTFWMSYPIAVIFLDGSGRVLRKCSCIPKRRIVGQRGAKFALEVATDALWVRRIDVGSQLRWT